MLGNLVQTFLGARQGQEAMGRLQAQGFAPTQAEGMLRSAFPVAAQAFHGAASTGGADPTAQGASRGLMEIGSSHYVTNFLSGAVSGLLRGEGLIGAAADGAQGVVGGHVAEVLASRFGMPSRLAGTVGAIITPLAVDFLWERVRGGLDLGSILGGAGGGTASSAPTTRPGAASRWGAAPSMQPAGGVPAAPAGGWGGASPGGGVAPMPGAGGGLPGAGGGLMGAMLGAFGGGALAGGAFGGGPTGAPMPSVPGIGQVGAAFGTPGATPGPWPASTSPGPQPGAVQPGAPQPPAPSLGSLFNLFSGS